MVSIKGAAKKALRNDELAREKLKKLSSDSFQNFAASIGIGTNNVASAGGYGFNPITRVRTELEWIHRGSWLGGLAVDLVADDMTRAGVELKGEIEPEDIEAIEEYATAFGVWNKINEAIKWARLYGGSLAVHLIEGQDLSTPLRWKTIGKDQYKGLAVLDRWMVEPSLQNLIDDYGPNLGLPKFYRVTALAPALRGESIHYSRCIRLEAITLPYWQRLMENMWSISIIERMYDRMVAFDSTTQGAAQLVYKAYLRTIKIKGLRELISAGGPALQGLVKHVAFMRQQQSLEGITLLDAEDEFEKHEVSSFTGLSDVLLQLGQQLSGSIEVPLTKLFGQAPAGLNSTGESDMRNYYDGIAHKQQSQLSTGVAEIYRMIALSLGKKISSGFRIAFRPLWQLTEEQKATIADKITTAVVNAHDSGIISPRTAIEELKQSSNVSGVYSNIRKEDIESASEELAPALPEEPDGDDDEPRNEGPGKSKKSKRASAGDAETQKVSKLSVHYTDQAQKSDHCGQCRFFESPQSCRRVAGRIASTGWCELFEAAD